MDRYLREPLLERGLCVVQRPSGSECSGSVLVTFRNLTGSANFALWAFWEVELPLYGVLGSRFKG
jgi:hypothetical protein